MKKLFEIRGEVKGSSGHVVLGKSVGKDHADALRRWRRLCGQNDAWAAYGYAVRVGRTLMLQAISVRDKLIPLKPESDVIVYANAGAGDYVVSSSTLRADNAIEREDFFQEEAGDNADLFLVKATDARRYEETHGVNRRS